jgi:hypothetical protein
VARRPASIALLNLTAGRSRHVVRPRLVVRYEPPGNEAHDGRRVEFVPSGVAHFQGILNFWPSQFVVAAETAARELGSLNVSEALGRPSSSGELPVAL